MLRRVRQTAAHPAAPRPALVLHGLRSAHRTVRWLRGHQTDLLARPRGAAPLRQVPRPRQPGPGHGDPRGARRARPGRRRADRGRGRAPVRVPAVVSAAGGLGAAGPPGLADRGWAPRAAARHPAADRAARRRRCRRNRPPDLSGLSAGRAHRQAAGRGAGLPDLHRTLPHPGVRALRRAPRTGHPRRGWSAGLRQLLHHRPGEPADLPELRAPPPGRTANPARAAVLGVPHAPGPDLLDLRRDDTVRHLPRHRPALVSGLPASVRRVLSLRPPPSDRLRHHGRPALRRLHRTPHLARLPHLQRPQPPPSRPVRPLPDQQPPGRADGPRHRLPAARAANPAREHLHRRAPHHRDALADQARHRPGPGRPRRGAPAADPPGVRRAGRHPGPGPPAPNPRRRRCPPRARRGTRPTRAVPGRPPRLPARPGPPQDLAPLHDLAPAPAATRPQQRSAHLPATGAAHPQPRPRGRRVPGLARGAQPHPGLLHAGRSRPLAQRRLGCLPLRDRQLHPLGTRQQAHRRSPRLRPLGRARPAAG